jgi:putative tricarboxylic transport membrane protein
MTVDRISFIAIMAISIYGLVSALLMPLGKIQVPGPGFFPLLLSGILFFLSTLGIFLSFMEKREVLHWKSFWGNLLSPIKILLCYGLSIALFEPIGYLITSLILLGLLFWWVSGRTLWKALVFGAIGSLGSYLLFVHFLRIPLPRGIFGFF